MCEQCLNEDTNDGLPECPRTEPVLPPWIHELPPASKEERIEWAWKVVRLITTARLFVEFNPVIQFESERVRFDAFKEALAAFDDQRSGEAQEITVEFAVGDKVRIRHGANRQKLGTVVAVNTVSIDVQVDGDSGSALPYFLPELELVHRDIKPEHQRRERAQTDRSARRLDRVYVVIGDTEYVWTLEEANRIAYRIIGAAQDALLRLQSRLATGSSSKETK